MEVANLPTVFGEEHWQVQVPDLWLVLRKEFIVLGNWILLSDDSLASYNEYLIEFIWILEVDLELSKRWHDEFLTVLPYTWYELLDFDGPGVSVIEDLIDSEVVIWHLNLHNLLSLLLRWILYNNQSLVIVRVLGNEITILLELVLHIRIKFFHFNSKFIVKFLGQEL